MYVVKFISKDDHIFEFYSSEKAEMAAIMAGEERIKDNGWEHYEYCFDSISKQELGDNNEQSGRENS